MAVLTLEGPYSPLPERPPDAEAIVVFSAGLFAPDGPRLRAEMDEDTLHRCLYAAWLYNHGAPCPVLVSGGKPDSDDPGPSCAAVMQDFLKHLDVKEADLLLEERSRNTHENAAECARLLRERGIRRVVLVVDAVDMARATSCLQKQGIEVVPAACHYRVTSFRLSLFSFIPTPGAARAIERVWHEWLGLLWYRLRGWI